MNSSRVAAKMLWQDEGEGGIENSRSIREESATDADADDEDREDNPSPFIDYNNEIRYRMKELDKLKEQVNLLESVAANQNDDKGMSESRRRRSNSLSTHLYGRNKIIFENMVKEVTSEVIDDIVLRVMNFPPDPEFAKRLTKEENERRDKIAELLRNKSLNKDEDEKDNEDNQHEESFFINRDMQFMSSPGQSQQQMSLSLSAPSKSKNQTNLVWIRNMISETNKSKSYSSPISQSKLFSLSPASLTFVELKQIVAQSFNVSMSLNSIMLSDAAGSIYPECCYVHKELSKLRSNSHGDFRLGPDFPELFLTPKSTTKISRALEDVKMISAFRAMAMEQIEPAPFIPQNFFVEDNNQQKDDDLDGDATGIGETDSKKVNWAMHGSGGNEKSVWRFDGVLSTRRRILFDFLISFFLFVILCIFTASSTMKTFYKHLTYDAIHSGLYESIFYDGPDDLFELSLPRVISWNDFWGWVDSPLRMAVVPLKQNPFAPARLLGYEPVVLWPNVVRFRQSRVKHLPIENCIPPAAVNFLAQHNIVSCWPPYNINTRDTSTISTAGNGAFVFHQSSLVYNYFLGYPLPDEVSTISGKLIPKYDASGYFLDVDPTTFQTWSQQLSYLRPQCNTNLLNATYLCSTLDTSRPWIDEGTRMVAVEFNLLNSNVPSITKVAAVFETQTDGFVHASLQVSGINLMDDYGLFIAYLLGIGCCIFYILFVEYSYWSLAQAMYRHERRRLIQLGNTYRFQTIDATPEKFYPSELEERLHDAIILAHHSPNSWDDEEVPDVSKFDVTIIYLSNLRAWLNISIFAFCLSGISLSGLAIFSPRLSTVYSWNYDYFVDIGGIFSYFENGAYLQALALACTGIKIVSYFRLVSYPFSCLYLSFHK